MEGNFVRGNQEQQESTGEPEIPQIYAVNVPGKGMQYVQLLTLISLTEPGISFHQPTSSAANQSDSSSTYEAVTMALKTRNIAASNNIFAPQGSEAVIHKQNQTRPRPLKTTNVPESSVSTISVNDIRSMNNEFQSPYPSTAKIIEFNQKNADESPRKNQTTHQNCLSSVMNPKDIETMDSISKSGKAKYDQTIQSNEDKLKSSPNGKGCSCKRSSCLNNYCDCYKTHIFCSTLCRCYDNAI